MNIDTEKLENYFLEIFPDTISSDEALSLFYLLSGIRPGALIMSAQNREIGPIKDFCEDFGLKFEFFHSNEEVFDDKGLFIARDPERFKMLEESEGSFYGCSDLNVGKFLGYNLEATKYYEENFRAGEEYRKKLSELVEEEKISGKETVYLNLICYVPVPEEDSILREAARGKKRARKLRRFDEKHGVKIGEEFLKEFLEEDTI